MCTLEYKKKVYIYPGKGSQDNNESTTTSLSSLNEFIHEIIAKADQIAPNSTSSSSPSFVLVKSKNPWETIDLSLPLPAEPVTIISLDSAINTKSTKRSSSIETSYNHHNTDVSSLFSIEYLLQQPDEKIWYFLTESKSKELWQQHVDRFLNTNDVSSNTKLIQRWIQFLQWVQKHHYTHVEKSSDLRCLSYDLLNFTSFPVSTNLTLFQQWIIKMASLSPSLPPHLNKQVQQLSHWVFDHLLNDETELS
jgi:hypothetical protein